MLKYDILKAHIKADAEHYEEMAQKSDNPLFASASTILNELVAYIKYLEEVFPDEESK